MVRLVALPINTALDVHVETREIIQELEIGCPDCVCYELHGSLHDGLHDLPYRKPPEVGVITRVSLAVFQNIAGTLVILICSFFHERSECRHVP